MATFESTIWENGNRSLRKHFLNIKETTKGSWHEKRRFGN